MIDPWELIYVNAMMPYEMTQIKEFTQKLNTYLMDRFGYKSPLGKANKNRTIYLDRDRVSLFIRYRIKGEYWENETLVIAMFGFKEKRKGHGTDLLKFLCEQCEYYGIHYIGIEKTNEQSKAFAIKYGFHELTEKEQFLIRVSDLRSGFVNTF